LNDEEEEAVMLEENRSLHDGRKQVPGNPLLWVELTESIYRATFLCCCCFVLLVACVVWYE
jgi:hypothetical protein